MKKSELAVCRYFLADYVGDDYVKVIDKLDSNKVIVWEPFETFSKDALAILMNEMQENLQEIYGE